MTNDEHHDPLVGDDGELEVPDLFRSGKKSRQQITWAEAIFDSVPGRAITPFGLAICLGTGIHLLGLWMAEAADVRSAYADSWAMRLTALGSTWCLLSVYAVGHKLPSALLKLTPSIKLPAHEYQTAVNYWGRKNTSREWNIIAFLSTLMVMVFGGILLVAIFDDEGPYREAMFDHHILQEAWSMPAVMVQVIITAFAISTAIKLMWAATQLLPFFRRLPIKSNAKQLSENLTPLMNLTVLSAVNWCIGVGLMGILVFERVGVDSVLVMSLMAAPAIIIHATIRNIFAQKLRKGGTVGSLFDHTIIILFFLLMLGVPAVFP
jgi:hypothetical protein